MAATPMFEAVVAVQNITDLAPTPIGVVIADRAVALWAPWFFRAAAKDERRLQAIACLPSRRPHCRI
jgi:hypothetical protein